jgi:TPR repeat protein
MRAFRSWFLVSTLALLGAPTLPADEPTAEAAPAVEPMPPKTEPGAEEYWTALALFETKRPEDLKAGRAALERAAAREYTHAQLLLGECYAGGSYGFPVDKTKAISYMRLAAERGNAFAQVSYGLCLFSGFGARKNAEKAQQWLSAAVAEKADYSTPVRPAAVAAPTTAAPESTITGEIYVDPVENAKARAHFVLGAIADDKKDVAAAQAHYVAAATAGGNGRAGIQNASILAAVNYAFGHGVPRDRAKATEMLALAKTQVKRAAVSIVHNFASQKLIDDFAVADVEETVAKASDEMETNLEFGIATEFTDKKSKDYNPQEAIQWFEVAAENGKEWAMLELGFLYSNGEAAIKSPEKAFHWFQKAGEGEHPKHYAGVANLVICYQNGIGVAADPAKAREIAQRHKDSELVSYLTLKGKCPKTILTYEQLTALNKEWA